MMFEKDGEMHRRSANEKEVCIFFLFLANRFLKHYYVIFFLHNRICCHAIVQCEKF